MGERGHRSICVHADHGVHDKKQDAVSDGASARVLLLLHLYELYSEREDRA